MIRGIVATGAVLASVLLAGPATADDETSPSGTATAQSLSGTAQPGVAVPGDTVAVEGTGWPAGTQVQAVVCGDLAIGGSSTCAQESSVLGYVNDDGFTQMNLVVAAPPRPCPCVIRLASYNGPVVAVDIPFVVAGHPVGTPPAPILPSAMVTVTSAEVQGDTGIGAWFGGSPTKKLVLTVRNDGDAVAVNPELTVGVGKAVDLEAQPVRIDDFTLDPGQTQTVTVEVRLPFAAFGQYRIIGQVGAAEGGGYVTTWSSYPWGLVALNVIGLLLLAWGISRRVVARRRRRLGERAGVAGVALGATPGLERPYVLPDVVYVSEVGGFLVSPKMAGRTNLFKRVDGRLELKDLAALGALTAAGTPMLSLPATESPASTGDAVVDIGALDAHLARLDGEPTVAADTEVLEVRGTARRRPTAGRGPAGRRSSRRTPPQAAQEDAVVDLDAVDSWFSTDRERGEG